MDFSMKDIAVITTMSGAIIFMSFAFPANGLADANNETVANDIPEFNITGSSFDLVGDFPQPRTTQSAPTQGRLIYNQSRSDGGFSSSAWMYGDKQDGWRLSLVNNGTNSDTTLRAKFVYWFNGDILLAYYEPDPGEFNKSNRFETIEITNSQRGNWSIELTADEITNINQSNFTAAVDYEIFNQPEISGGSWLSRLPVVGGLFSAADALASLVGWIGSILYWVALTSLELIVAGVTILFSTVSYLVAMLHWMLSTYFSVVTAAGSWASVVLMLPGVMLFLEFTKLAMLGVKLLPTT